MGVGPRLGMRSDRCATGLREPYIDRAGGCALIRRRGRKGGAMRTGAPRCARTRAQERPEALQGSQRPSAPVSRQTGSSCVRALMLSLVNPYPGKPRLEGKSGKFGPRVQTKVSRSSCLR